MTLAITKRYSIKFELILSLAIFFNACINHTGVAPKGITYSYYNNGAGTSVTDGALVINIHSTNTNKYNEYYIVKITGVGTYTLQPGTIQFSAPNLSPDNYTFSVERICRSNNSNKVCYSLTSTGTASITAATTTAAEVWF